MKTLNFALIGRGKFGKNYERLLQEIPGISLKAIVTASSGNLKSVLQNPKIDCVVIATPPKTHFAIAKAAIEAGKNVLLEKPMVLNIKEAKKLKGAVNKSRKTFMVGFQYLYNDYLNYLKNNLASLGKIIAVRSEHLISPKRKGADIFWDVAPHPLSIFQYLFNPKKLVSVKGEISPNSASVKVKFKNSPRLEMIMSNFGNKKIRKLTVVGEKAAAIIDETLEKNKLVIFRNGRKLVPKINFQEPLKNEVGHFINCIQNQKTPLTDVNLGYLNTQWLEEISQKFNQ